MPWLKIVLSAAGRGQVSAIAKVDSGATVTVLPRDLVEAMGVRGSELEAAGEAATAGGGRVRKWRSRVPLELRVLAEQAGTGTALYGPVVPLEGTVIEGRSLLLGQRDFFAVFDVLFDRNASVPAFELR